MQRADSWLVLIAFHTQPAPDDKFVYQRDMQQVLEALYRLNKSGEWQLPLNDTPLLAEIAQTTEDSDEHKVPRKNISTGIGAGNDEHVLSDNASFGTEWPMDGENGFESMEMSALKFRWCLGILWGMRPLL